MYLELDAASATLERFVADWVAGVDHGEGWVSKVYSMKWRAVEAAKRVVDVALDVVGGAGMFRGGAYKPRTSPYAFSGLGESGLRILAEAKAEHGMPIVTELMDVRDLDAVLEVADDGHGVRPGAPTGGSGLGLSSMRLRAEELGGSLVLDSSSDGTRVQVEVPR